MTHTKSTKAAKEMLMNDFGGRPAISDVKILCDPLRSLCEALRATNEEVTHTKSTKAAKEMLKDDFFDGHVIIDGAVDDSLDAVFQVRGAEVNQQTQAPIAQAKLGQQLLAVQWLERFNRFQFDDEFVGNKQVSAETFLKSNAVVRNRNRLLPFDGDTVLAELIGEQDFIDRFQETRPEAGVQLVSQVEHHLRELVLVHSRKGSHNGHKVRNVKSLKPRIPSPFATFVPFV